MTEYRPSKSLCAAETCLLSVDIAVPQAGALISTGKVVDRDGLSRTCNTTADRRMFLLYGRARASTMKPYLWTYVADGESPPVSPPTDRGRVCIWHVRICRT